MMKKRRRKENYIKKKRKNKKPKKLKRIEIKIINYIEEHPGCSFREIQQKLSVTNAESAIMSIENNGGLYFYQDDNNGLHHIGE